MWVQLGQSSKRTLCNNTEIYKRYTWSSWLSCFDVFVVSCNLKPLCMLFKRAIKIAQPLSY